MAFAVVTSKTNKQWTKIRKLESQDIDIFCSENIGDLIKLTINVCYFLEFGYFFLEFC